MIWSTQLFKDIRVICEEKDVIHPFLSVSKEAQMRQRSTADEFLEREGLDRSLSIGIGAWPREEWRSLVERMRDMRGG